MRAPSLARRGRRRARRASGGVSLIPAHYGTDSGQVPLDLRLDAPVVTGGLVRSARNDGGAGATLAGTAPVGQEPTFQASPPATDFAAVGVQQVVLANSFNLDGTMLFIPTNIPSDYPISATSCFLAGGARSIGARRPTTDTLFLWVANGDLVTSVAGITVPFASGPRVYAFRMSGGKVAVYRDGVVLGEITTPVAPYMLDRFAYSNVNAPDQSKNWPGVIGRAVSLKVSDLTTRLPAESSIWQELAAQYGITLPISALYGTGPNQILVHHDPLNAVMNGTQVVSVPNSGGGGATYDATAGGATITRTGTLLDMAVAADYLQLATPIELVGKRLFFLARRDGTGQVYIMSNASPAISGRLTHQSFDDSTNASRLNFGGVSGATSGRIPRGVGALVLYEIEFTPTTYRIWTNGNESVDGPVAGSFTSIPIDQLGRSNGGVSTPSFTGGWGDLILLNNAGPSGARQSEVAAIRQYLAAKQGVPLG